MDLSIAAGEWVTSRHVSNGKNGHLSTLVYLGVLDLCHCQLQGLIVYT